MNLAVKDIRHNLVRFMLTTLGVGLLLMVVMGIRGVYRGIEEDSTYLIENVGTDIWVVQGQYVAQGEAIGALGCTGYCTGTHLHFEIWIEGIPVDPLAYLP